MVNEYDKRLLDLMRKQILLFRQGSLSLQILINNIGSLIDTIEAIDMSWKDNCRNFLWDLEQVYAVALDREKKELDEEDINIVTISLKEIEILINQILPS
jgi:hypothetical protein